MFHPSEFRLVTRADVAQIFGVCVKTIDNYIQQGLLPQPVAFASKEYWHPDDIKIFLDETFKRAVAGQTQSAQSVSVVSPKSDAPSQLPPDNARKVEKARQKSHPVERAKVRQSALLQKLNSGE